ncbi:hypothetical protein DIS24_g1193 [Lasiodiplodia hormozganensis]|uniref:Uncharacterized protein n=1 Tax=Lasiodiplodia hormozganensis TaxID=869390 RepID=A0AA39Z5I3_9PEZI|nr:hypothetical protein DIS24_g1193 [Lasiodiplodia hormozganensis]
MPLPKRAWTVDDVASDAPLGFPPAILQAARPFSPAAIVRKSKVQRRVPVAMHLKRETLPTSLAQPSTPASARGNSFVQSGAQSTATQWLVGYERAHANDPGISDMVRCTQSVRLFCLLASIAARRKAHFAGASWVGALL